MLQGIVLVNGTIFLAEIIEVIADLGEPNCKLINPCIVNIDSDQITIKKYLNNITNDSEFMIVSDKILTLFEPTGYLKSKYFSLVEGAEKVEKRESNLEENVD